MPRPLVVDKRMSGRRGDTYTASNVSQLADLINKLDADTKNAIKRIALLEETVIDGSGTANYIPKWSDADTLANSSLFDNGTSIGFAAVPSAAFSYEFRTPASQGNPQHVLWSGLDDIANTTVYPGKVFGAFYNEGANGGTLRIRGIGDMATGQQGLVLEGIIGGTASSTIGVLDFVASHDSGGGNETGLIGREAVASGRMLFGFYNYTTPIARAIADGYWVFGSSTVASITPGNIMHLYANNATDLLETADKQQLLIEQDGTGDAAIGFELTGGQRYSAGIDNSDSDKWKLRDITNTRDDLSFDTSGNAVLGASLTITTIAAATTDTDKFLVSDGGVVKYRTGAEISAGLNHKITLVSSYPYTVLATDDVIICQ